MNTPFDPRWLYEMGKDTTKRRNRSIGNGAFIVIVICLIISLILLGGLVAFCVWYFAS